MGKIEKEYGFVDSKQLNPRLTGSFTLSGSLSTEKNTRIVSNLTEIIKVTVVSDNGNKYVFEGASYILQ